VRAPGGSSDVLVAGVGVAGLEAALALRALAPGITTRLLAPGAEFVFAPAAVALALRGEVASTPLGALLDGTGLEVTRGALAGIDAGRRRALTTDGREIPFRRLVIAVGARQEPFLGRPALTFGGADDAGALRRLLDEVKARARRGPRSRIAVVVPPGPGWPLPAYELALLLAAELQEASLAGRVEICLVTAEPAPLAAFGPVASEAVARDLVRAGVAAAVGVVAVAWRAGRLTLAPAGAIAADRVIALPRLLGPRIGGVPGDDLGFVPADADGRVRGLEGVYVVGDAGPFPIKQGGIGCAQADTVASIIATEIGAAVEKIPFDPTLRAFLLEGQEERYLRGQPTGGPEDSAGASWLLRMRQMTGKVAGRYLAPFLESRLQPLLLHDEPGS
jgi:sulfide:quinone oxidoreductase